MSRELDSYVEKLDDTMIGFFQHLTNRIGVSNFKLAEICCWLCTLSTFMWVEQRQSAATLLIFAFFCAILIKFIFFFRSMQETEDEYKPGPRMQQWLSVNPGGYIRTFVTIILVMSFGQNAYYAIHHDNARLWFQLAFTMLVIPIMYFSTCHPPKRRKRVRARKD